MIAYTVKWSLWRWVATNDDVGRSANSGRLTRSQTRQLSMTAKFRGGGKLLILRLFSCNDFFQIALQYVRFLQSWLFRLETKRSEKRGLGSRGEAKAWIRHWLQGAQSRCHVSRCRVLIDDSATTTTDWLSDDPSTASCMAWLCNVRLATNRSSVRFPIGSIGILSGYCNRRQQTDNLFWHITIHQCQPSFFFYAK